MPTRMRYVQHCQYSRQKEQMQDQVQRVAGLHNLITIKDFLVLSYSEIIDIWCNKSINILYVIEDIYVKFVTKKKQ